MKKVIKTWVKSKAYDTEERTSIANDFICITKKQNCYA